MSATMSSVAESPKIQNTQVKPKAPRKPTLAAKYNKMLVFGFSLVESLRAKGVFSDELVEQVFAELHLMSPLDDQVAYYESVLSQASANAKVMKKFIAAKNKPVKEPKVRKPRAKKTVTVQSDASDDDVIQNLVDAARNEPKEKKPRKNAKKAEAEEAEPVVEDPKPKGKAKKAKAETEAPVVEEPKPKGKAKAETEAPVVEEPKPKGKAKKAKVEEAPAVEEPKPKGKAKKVKAETPVLDSPAPAVEEPKTKAKAKKPEPEPVVQDDDDDDEEILTKETTIDGQLFLIDQNNNLYDPVSHQFIRSL
jgi:hypothetical protein